MKKIKMITLLLVITIVGLSIQAVVYNVFALTNDNNETSAMDTTDTDSTKVVVLDAGHGGYDSGSTSYDEQYLEKDIVLDITLRLGKILEAEGIEVIYTRNSDDVSWSSDNKEDLSSRVAISNQNETDLFVSIHLNYYDTDDVRGFETYVNSEDTKALAFANLVQAHLATLDYSYNRGIKDETSQSLYVIRNNQVTSALIELGFISSYLDLSYLISEEGSTKIVNALKTSILTYFDEYFE